MNCSSSDALILENVNDDQEDDDLHFCGRCRLTFADITEFLSHKKQCKKASEANKNLATDEAAVISLLANQLSSQRSGDDLDQLTLIIKDEFEAIAETSHIPVKKTTKKNTKNNATIQTFKTEDQLIKIVKGNRLPCAVPGCQYTAAQAKDMGRHMRVHSGEKPYECKFCSKRFSRADKLKNHERIHTGEKPYSCSLCPYGTNDSGSLKKHMRVHLDERPYKCQLCPYRSRDSSQLVVHLRTHTNDRPFGCPHHPCTSAFKTNSDLKRHSKLHVCPYCPFKSGIPQALKTHLETDHSENFTCTDCDFLTNSKCQLKAHLKTHKPDSVSCAHCDFVTDKKKILKAHEKTHTFTVVHKCDACDFTAPSKMVLIKHGRKYHSKMDTGGPSSYILPDSPVKAKRVKKEAPAVVKKEPVMKMPVFSPNFSCGICNATFIRDDSFRSHMKQHGHRDEPSGVHYSNFVEFQP